ncbi:MAG: CoA-binding protein [Promethearchaeota archaeon]
MEKDTHVDLTPFFNPKSVALIGVSRDMNKFNGILLKNLLEVSYPGKIYPVNPHAKEILGIPCYSRVVDLPEIPELGIILHSDVVSILENCGKKGIDKVIIQADVTLKDEDEQEKIEKEIEAVSRKYNIQFTGPSLIGLFNFPDSFTTSIIPVRDRISRMGKDRERAGIGFMAQSGGLSGACGWWAPSQGISFSKIVHLGIEYPGAIKNEHFLNYLVDDAQVKVISLFLRHIDDALVEAVRRVALKKPILFKKCGRPINVEKLERAGALRVDNYLDLFEISKAFIFCPMPRGNRIGLIGPSSGAIDVVLSEFKKNGLSIADPSKRVRDKLVELLQGKLPKRCNPVDYWPPPRFFGHEVGRVHYEAANLLLSDKNIDAIFLVLEFFQEIEFDLMIFKELVEKYPDKPIMGVLMQAEEDGANRMKNAATLLKIPLFQEPERLVKAYGLMYKFSRMKEGDAKDGSR